MQKGGIVSIRMEILLFPPNISFNKIIYIRWPIWVSMTCQRITRKDGAQRINLAGPLALYTFTK